jgi:hypothetical protein
MIENHFQPGDSLFSNQGVSVMPMQKGTSNFTAEMAGLLKGAHNTVKGAETVRDAGGSLPAGIENGVARLVKCGFGKFEKGANKGKWFFMAQAIVQSPDKHGGIPIKGKRTKIGPEPLCETPSTTRKTVGEHLGWIENHLRLMGVKTEGLEFEELEPICKKLEKVGPYIGFRTWKGDDTTISQQGDKWIVAQGQKKLGVYASETMAKQKHPFAGRASRVNEVWEGLVEGFVPESPNGQMVDESGKETVVSDDENSDGTTEEEVTETTEESGDQGNPNADGADELGELAALADGGEKKANLQAAADIKKRALAAGIGEDAIDATNNWAEVVALIEAAGGGETETEEGETEEEVEETETEEEAGPQVGQTVKYEVQTKIKKGGKTFIKKKMVKCEITKIDKENGTATIKDEDSGTIYKGVEIDKLITE